MNMSTNSMYNPWNEGNNGIWMPQEDPDSFFYYEKGCTNAYLDLVKGKFDSNFDDYCDYYYDKYDEYEDAYNRIKNH